MREANLVLAVDKLGSDKAKERNEGLEDLKRLLQSVRGTSRLDGIEDDGFHKIFESVFRYVRIEKAAYVRASSSKVQSASATRLSSGASTLRLTVEVANDKITPRTVNAVLDHIADSLQTAATGHCEPLAHEYFRTLRILLENAAHTEHLRDAKWQEVVGFVLDSISEALPGDFENLNDSFGTPQSESKSSNGQSVSMVMTSRQTARSIDQSKSIYVEDLVFSLAALMNYGNHPVLSQGNAIKDNVINLLRRPSLKADVQKGAFRVANKLLGILMTEDLKSFRGLLKDCVPIIRRLWNSKSLELKDEMVITLVFFQDLLHFRSFGDDALFFKEEAESIYSVMHADYTRRQEKELLHSDEITFFDSPQLLGCSLDSFGPDLRSHGNLTKWITVSIMATLLLQTVTEVQDRDDTLKYVNQPSKRRRLTTSIESVLDRALAGSHVERIAALQLISFSLHEAPQSVSFFQASAGRILVAASGENAEAASWTFLAYSSFASLPQAQTPELRPLWAQVLQTISRHASSAAAGRAACHLIHVMIRQHLVAVSESHTLLETVLGGGFGGPGSVTDSALELFTVLLQHRGSVNLISWETIRDKTLTWINTSWHLASYTDRISSSRLSQYADPIWLANLLLCCANHAPAFRSRPSQPLLTSLIQTLHTRRQRVELVKYLNEPGEAAEGLMKNAKHDRCPTALRTSSDGPTYDRTICTLLLQKIKTFRDLWISATAERASNATSDLIRVVSAVCLISLLVGKVLSKVAANDLLLSAREFWKELCIFIGDQDATNMTADREILVTLLSSAIGVEPPMQQVVRAVLADMVVQGRAVLEFTLPNTTSLENVVEESLIDFDQSIRSNHGQDRGSAKSSGLGRIDVPFATTAAARTSASWLKLRLETESRFADDEVGELVDPGKLIGFLLDLDTVELLGLRGTISNMLQQCSTINRTEASRLLEKSAQACLQDYAWERSEVALCFCLEVMESLASLWAAEEEDDLNSTAYDIYSWFMQVILGKNFASDRVAIGIAEMLREVLATNANFARGDSDPSPRTHLFVLLESGSNVVRYYSITSVLQIFEHFVLSEHEKIFDDILERLPADPSSLEGIALRLYVLTEIACKWRTLLRRSIYHLFEAPGLIPDSTNHARQCIKRISETLGMERPGQVFQLFAPQILYTWLQSQDINSIPFGIFDFASLSNLLAAVSDEVVAQVIMREDKHNLDQLVQIMALSFEELVQSSFSRVEAYCIARDIGLPRSQTGQTKSVESAMKKQLGSAVFSQLVQSNFPAIVADLFLSTEADQEFEKALQRNEKNVQSVRALQTFRSLIVSDSSVASNQQPSFRSKYLLDEVYFVCHRANVDMEVMWTPAMVVYVSRKLLDAAVPALGSFHACAILRKICLVLSVASPTMLTGYPLEMLLHAIQPFLVDFHTSRDAMSICQYLLNEGKPYLETSANFFCGFAVTTFAFLLDFLDTKQDSTTQESHFKATMTNAQTFHEWLAQYTISYQAKGIPTSTAQDLRSILTASANIRKTAVANKGSNEGTLLLALLKSIKHENDLLTLSASESTIKLLSNSILMPDGTHDSIFRNDQDAIEYAPVLIRLLTHLKVESKFRIWAAKVIGWAFAASGKVPTFTEYRSDELSTADTTLVHSNSESRIVQKICALLFSRNAGDASIAERTLQAIISGLIGNVDSEVLSSSLPTSMIEAFSWAPYIAPSVAPNDSLKPSLVALIEWDSELSFQWWTSQITSILCNSIQKDPLLAYLPAILVQNPGLAVEVFPYAVHLALLAARGVSHMTVREDLSSIFEGVLTARTQEVKPFMKVVLETVVYLRTQPILGESTISDREKWLDVDLLDAARAASFTNLHEVALLCLEIFMSRPGKSSRNRRSSLSQVDDQITSMHEVFENLNDPDFFYGVPREPSLGSIVKRLEFEKDGLKSLSFESARFDAEMRRSSSENTHNATGLLKALNTANLQGIAYDLYGRHAKNQQSTIRTALSLRRWDMQPPEEGGSEPQVFHILRHLHQSEDSSVPTTQLNDALLKSLDTLLIAIPRRRIDDELADLASVTELDGILKQSNAHDMEKLWLQMANRTGWMSRESLEHSQLILTTREAAFSSLGQKSNLSKAVNTSMSDALLYEVQAVRQNLQVSQAHEALQTALNSATYLTSLADHALTLGVDVSALAEMDLAKVLWQYQEMPSSIQILKGLMLRTDLQKQAIPVSRLEILAELGHHVAEARLEKPEEVQSKYLLTAIREIKNSPSGAITGRVHHELATFCDKQLQNPEDLDDYRRIEKLRDRKEMEVQDLERMVKDADGKQRDTLKVHHAKAKQWLDLDDREYKRLRKIREGFLEKCLSNYLLCLKACDDFDDDVLRFVALWLDQAGNAIANVAVEGSIKHVASRKFAPLMNQLSSRLLDDQKDAFQRILFDLVVKICTEHPFHGMYQIFASSKWKGGKDEQALSRHAAANKVAERLRESRDSGPMWISVHNSNISFVRFAVDRLNDSKLKSGSKTTLSRIPSGSRLEQEITNLTTKIPPPTMKIGLRADCNYSHVPRLLRFEPNVSIAGGVSAPKIVTAVASDGSRHKQLFKGGNDDLRQDAIMEQVFEQVSNLLRRHRNTRQRNLGIRTYRVLPLTANAGIIEFVQNTIPLHDYLLPAHQKHFPRDMKPNQCRKSISDVQSRSVDTRVSVFKKVTDHFQPVMRFFFMERFMDPSEWFQKRLNYSRSTAAISILGHVLGLGDRHGHNILLDEQSGEVVHIDLGVAFEAGRVLPVPEVVPFRLTRDLVDGMGITGTEGPFRRCCNFTLEALRQDSDSIMTILDVLRYDPLYSWSVSPLRMKRMQEEQQLQQQQQQQQQDPNTSTAAPSATAETNISNVGGGGGVVGGKKENNINEPSEADRALTVVAKKLGKSLSVEATVNELIQQATNERNLAVLYCGWAAYA